MPKLSTSSTYLFWTLACPAKDPYAILEITGRQLHFLRWKLALEVIESRPDNLQF